VQTFRCDSTMSVPLFEDVEAESIQAAALAYEAKHGTLPKVIGNHTVFGRCACGCGQVIVGEGGKIFTSVGDYWSAHVDIVPKQYLHVPPSPQPATTDLDDASVERLEDELKAHAQAWEPEKAEAL
jgi:hypothetical protein